MSDEKRSLLTRRQVMALFGGTGIGAAIVAEGAVGPESTGGGDIVGGADGMPAPYKVGEMMWKGPLSVRSEVPQEDGVTYIQTDAGDQNDRFKFHHYNGGWGDVGMEGSDLRYESVSLVGQNGEATMVDRDPNSDSGGIQAAIDNASPGDTLVLKPNTTYDVAGTYSDPEPIIKIDKSLRLKGFGHSSVIRLEDNVTDTDEGAKIIEVHADDVELLDFTIDGNHQNQSQPSANSDGHNILQDRDYTGLLLDNVYSKNGTGDGIEPFGDKIRVINCRMEDNWEQHVHANGSNDLLVTGCIFDNEVNNSMINTYASQSDNSTEDTVIEGNIFLNGQVEVLKVEAGNGGVGVVEFKDNLVNGPVGTLPAVRVLTGKVTIQDNHFTSGSHHCIEITGSGTVTDIADHCRRKHDRTLRQSGVLEQWRRLRACEYQG